MAAVVCLHTVTLFTVGQFSLSVPYAMANSRKENTQATLDDSSPNRSESIQTRNYQDEAASNESRLKAIWGEQFGTVKKETVFYRKAVVLLLSWHPDVDDLHTDKEVRQ